MFSQDQKLWTVLSLIFILFVDDDAYFIYSEAWKIPISSMLKIVGIYDTVTGFVQQGNSLACKNLVCSQTELSLCTTVDVPNVARC